MEAIILAGGFGTRLKSVVPDLPKPMAPVNGRPFLALLLDALKEKGFSRIILSVGYRHQTIRDYFGDSYRGVALLYAIESSPLGTGGAIAMALQFAEQEVVFVFNGDTYLDIDAEGLLACWQRSNLPIMVVRHVSDAGRYGRVQLNQGCIHTFHEKGEAIAGLINAGCYVLPKTTFTNYCLPMTFSFETDFLPKALQNGTVLAYPYDGLFIDIGIPEDYHNAQLLLAGLHA
jgi:D-glycero-alpha-D-manno-heptose 1-phosphate guanylyltransferase